MDGVRQEVGLVYGQNILLKLVLKEKKFNIFGINSSVEVIFRIYEI